MMNPLISVVLCTHNDEKYIVKTIDSVLSQTFPDFEFIIWNDGSTDNTESIIKSYSDRRVRYFYHENTGLGIALSLACKEARGKYIARIDGDDVCMPDRLQKEVCFLERNKEYVLVSSSVLYIDENDIVIGRSVPWTWEACLRKRRSIAHPSVMFRNDSYKMTCGYLGLLSAQDRILWSKLIKYGKIKIFKQPLIKYRMLGSSVSHSFDTRGDYAKMLDIIRMKMCSDEIVRQEDIELHNYIYTIAKKSKKPSDYHYKPSLEDRALSVLKPLLGDKVSDFLVFSMKNIYMFFLLRAWK